MNANQISKQKKANKNLNDFSQLAGKVNPEKTDPSIITKTAESSKTMEAPLTISGQKSLTAQYLAREHSSLSQVLKTVRDHFADSEVQRYIDMLKDVPTDFGKKRFPVILADEDFTVPNFLPLYPFVTRDGQKKLCKIMKITEANTSRVAMSDGYYSGLNGEVIENNEKKIATIALNGTEFGLFEINVFTVSDVLAKIVKAKKTGAYQTIRAKIDAEKAATAVAKEAERAAKVAAKEAAKEEKQASDKKVA